MDYILIENQPVLKNPTMKSVQMILYSYFLINGVIKNTVKEIKFISARNKLKVYDGPPIEVKVKGKYAKRKRLSIKYCRYMISDDETKLLFYNGSVQYIKELPEISKNLYKTAWEIKQKVILDMAIDRAHYICQSQSLNIYLEDPTYTKLTKIQND